MCAYMRVCACVHIYTDECLCVFVEGAWFAECLREPCVFIILRKLIATGLNDRMYVCVWMF